MAEKYFTRREAEELLPFIEPMLNEARNEKKKLEAAQEKLVLASARIMAMGGSIPPFAELAKRKAAAERFSGRLAEKIEKIQQTGCVVKDVDEGLVDFPCLIDGQEALLCWKLGEKRIDWWHGLEEGFAGRKPLDAPSSDDSTHPLQ